MSDLTSSGRVANSSSSWIKPHQTLLVEIMIVDRISRTAKTIDITGDILVFIKSSEGYGYLLCSATVGTARVRAVR